MPTDAGVERDEGQQERDVGEAEEEDRGLRQEPPSLPNWFHSDADGADRDTSATRTRITTNATASTRPQIPKNHGQPMRSAVTDAATWPKIPATRNAADMAPTAPARFRGGTAAVR